MPARLAACLNSAMSQTQEPLMTRAYPKWP